MLTLEEETNIIDSPKMAAKNPLLLETVLAELENRVTVQT